jgi:uncharacterized protein YndB with AHSA1/START domain
MRRVSDESTHDFERAHLPAAAWPPTGWFEDWARGRDLYHLPGSTAPHELRWLVYRKDASQPDVDEAVLQVQASLHIDQACERVFDFAVAQENFARIFGAVPMVSSSSSSALVGSVELQAGGRRRITLRDGSTIVHELIDVVRPFRHRYRWSSAPKLLGQIVQDAEADWTFTPTANGTTVAWTYSLELPPKRAQRLLRLPLSIAVRRWMQRALEALREALEH